MFYSRSPIGFIRYKKYLGVAKKLAPLLKVLSKVIPIRILFLR